ncbi:MAG: acyltransferase family protein [Bacteroidaceae bacterium]|nr:acyltransferase family protein [Bacteroidaceae bacterium]
MGFAIVLVILYHAYCIARSAFYVFQPFVYGFIGVDIFLLLNALGCSYSVTKNGALKFYAHRLKKIALLFLIFASLRTLIQRFLIGDECSLFDWFCNLTTLSYWQIGGQIIEWYIAASLVLWLVTPWLIVIVRKLGVMAIVASIVLFAVIMKMTVTDQWYYACFMGRIPIYMTGIYLYCKEKINVLWFLPIAIVLVLCKANGYLIVSMGCPLLVLLLLKVKRCGNIPSLDTALSWMGKYTLEIYFANIIALDLFQELKGAYGTGNCLLGYFVVNILLAMIFVIISRMQRSVMG